jgi:dienelactone hydrolase
MGFIWSAERLPGDTRTPAADAVMRPWYVDVEAEAADGTLARATLTRTVAGPGVTRHVIRTAGIVGTLFLPPGAGPHPAVIVLTGGNGGIDEPMAAIYASRGYAALALAYFRAEGLPRGLVNIPLEYFETAIQWMRAQPWLQNRLLAVSGPSRGGELALLLGATFPDINAVVAWVPSAVVFWALGRAEPGDTRPRASWTHRGKPLPYLQEDNAGDTSLTADRSRPIAFSDLYRSQLRNARAVERATIPVERTRGPILMVSGTDDQMWPSSEMADIAMRRLAQHRHPFPFRHLRYERAGHLILVPYLPTTVRVSGLVVQGLQDYQLTMGGTPRADVEAGIDAWRNVLQFLADADRSR